MSAVPARALSEPMAETLPDGSMLVTVEQLKLLGNGDAKQGRRELRLIIAAERERTLPAPPTEKPKRVRIAGIEDEPAIFDLMMLDLAENAARVAPIDRDSVIAQVHIGTRRGAQPGGALGICGVIDGPDGKPIACCILVAVKWWWSQAYYISEMLNYVAPEHRRSHHIDDMINFEKWVADTWTKHFGYRVHVLFGVLASRRARAKIMLYRRKLAMTGAYFLYPEAPAPTNGGRDVIS